MSSYHPVRVILKVTNNPREGGFCNVQHVSTCATHRGHSWIVNFLGGISVEDIFYNCLFCNVRTVLLLPLFPPGLVLLFRFLTVPVSTKPFKIFLTVFGVGSLTPGNFNWKSARSCGMNCFFLSLSLLL